MTKPKRKSGLCCIGWKEATEGIGVIPRNQFDPNDKYRAETLEKLMKYMMGNYCPTCGNSINHPQ